MQEEKEQQRTKEDPEVPRLDSIRAGSVDLADGPESGRGKWGWDRNPLVPGWGTGPEKTRFTKCLGFALDWNLVFFWFLVPG